MRINLRWLLAGAVVLGVLGAIVVDDARGVGPAKSSASAAAEDAWPGHLPRAAFDRSGGIIRHGYQRGWCDVATAHKTVTLRWSAGSLANEHPDTPLPAVPIEQSVGWLAEADQPFRLRFHPLNATVLSSGSVLVAGLDAAGNTVLERWDLAWPAPMPTPVLVPGTELPQPVNVVLPQRSVRRILTAAVPGRTHVLNLCPIRRLEGEPTQALVQYLESGALYTVDLASGDHQLLASDVEGGTLGAIPTLSQQHFNALNDLRHSTAGFV